MALHVVDHPLARHLLTILRDKTTEPLRFRQASATLSQIIILESTRQMRLTARSIETPLEQVDEPVLDEGLAVVPILRAGLGMLESALRVFPDVTVGYIGLERDENTAQANIYYSKFPRLDNRYTICLDPMLATGGSAAHAIQLIKDQGAKNIKMVCVIASPEGVAKLQANHPDVDIYVAAVDRELNAQKYIVPGLGDFGDRLFGTM